MIGIGAAEMMILMSFLAGGIGAGLPLGMPPMPEDPVMARVAPAECLWYWSWSGMATPDPASKNHAEQILAEQEVRAFFGRLETVLTSALKENAGDSEQGQVAATEVPKVVRTILTRPAAVFIESASIDKKQVSGGLIVNVADTAAGIADFKQSLLKLEGLLTQGAVLKETRIGANAWRKLPLPPDAPQVMWTVKGRYFVVGIGKDSGEAILKRATGKPPAWLLEVRQNLPVDRVSMVSYLNLQGLLGIIKQVPQGSEIGRYVEALGLSSVSSLSNVTGFDEQGIVNKSLLAGANTKAGMLAPFASAKPLTAADLKPIPKDATFGAAARIDLDVWFKQGIGVLAKVNPEGHKEVTEELAKLEAQMGVNLSKDVFQSLGDVWCIYNSPGDGGFLITGVTAVAKVRDPKGLAKVNALIVGAVKAQWDSQVERASEGGFGYGPRGLMIKEFEHAGQRVHFLNFVGEPVPFAPAWCLTDDELIVSLFPQMIKSYLSRDPKAESLAALPEVAAALEQGPIHLAYQDTQEIVRSVYPLINMMAAAMCSELQRNGIDIDVSVLPSASAILPHLTASVTSVRSTPQGLATESRRSLPAGGGISGVAPVAAALVLPAVQAAREAARRSQSMNNLKQIALAMHNSHDVYRTFPSATTTSKGGKLSWRVQILPFIEQQALYEQFHLDEDWDSEHNKALISQMPLTYSRPGSTVAAEGRTNYLTIRGDDTAFPDAKKGLGFAQFTDGSSNTIMAVEVSDENAVVWTKPDDYEYDARDPAAGLRGSRPNGFLAAMCDGSVRFVSDAVAPDVLAAFFTRAGGEVVDWDALDAAPGRPRMETKTVAPESAPPGARKDSRFDKIEVPDETKTETFEDSRPELPEEKADVKVEEFELKE